MSSIHGKWITGAEEVPVFYTQFTAAKPAKAVLWATACGIYTAKLNGVPVSDELLRPGWTNYRKRIQYQEYDVTDLIQAHNRLELTVAPGWWAGYLNGEGKNHHYGDRLAAYAQLRLVYADGTEKIIQTDESWQYTTGAILSSELYHGETVDLTAVPAEPKPVEIYELPYPAELVPQIGAPVRIVERLPAREMIVSPKGEKILDFGQNIAGFVEFRIRGARGQKVTLRHAEELDRDGNLYTENLRTARATDTFVCSGGDDVFRPSFTFHGFRYISIEGLEHIDLNSFTACAISSDLRKTADFHCSDERVNRLWENINWSMRDNFVDLPTDCPQRDERLGWTGDASIFANTAGQLRDTYDFFRKWLHDLASEQSITYGIPDTIPNILMPPETPCGGSAVWGDAATLVPWSQYWLYGDGTVLKEQYESMRAWVEWMRRTETPEHLHKSGHQRGDWLAMDREEGRGMRGATDPYLISTAFYAESTRILRDSAKILGKAEDYEEYSALYDGIVAGFRREFITATGRVVSETQTALSLILCLGLSAPEQEKVILETLANNVIVHKNKPTTGFIGTPYLMKALSAHGRHDLAGKLLLNEDCPGWLGEVKLGATTIWERWDSKHADGSFDESGMNSFNHYAFGAVGAWMLEELAGIEAKEAGYRVISFHPRLTYGITQVSASRETPYGTASCAWSCKDGKIKISVTVPENATALLTLPEKEGVIRLEGGEYSYEYETETRLEPLRYTMDSTIAQLAENPAFLEGVERIMPGTGKSLGMAFLQRKTLGELAAMMPGDAVKTFQPILDEMNREE